MACWRQTSGSIGCPTQWWGRQYEIDNTIDNPVLPYPDYITHSVVWCDNPGNDSSRLIDMWGQFCTPPTTPFQISAGPNRLDITRSPTTVGGLFLDKGNALACRFIPSSVCVPYIVFHNAYYRASTAGIRTIVEIREEDPVTNLPKGVFGDNNVMARAAVLFSNLSNFAVPVNAILNSADTPHWIVMYSEDIFCATGNTGSAFRRVEFSQSNIGGNNLAVYSQSGAACGWALSTTIPSISFVSYKTDLCKGIVVIDDYGYAIDNVFIIDNCFKPLADVKNKNVTVGVKYTAPRTYRKVRFNVSYIRPDRTISGFSKDITGTVYGSNTVFLDSGEPYITGIDLEYKGLTVLSEVIQV